MKLAEAPPKGVELVNQRETIDAGLEISDHRTWIRVAEHNELGTFEAAFAFVLVGVSPRGLDQRSADLRPTRAPDPIELLALAAVAGQSQGKVCFEYRSGGSQAMACECLIHGSFVAATPAEAVEGILPLWRQAAHSFGSADGDYVFEPTEPENELRGDGYIRTVHLRRSPVRLGGCRPRSVGFRQPSEGRRQDHTVFASMMGAWGELSQTIGAVGATTLPVAIRFAIEPVTLSSLQIQSLTRSLAWLNTETPKGLAYGQSLRPHAGADPALQNELARVLACWIRRPFGFRITAELRTPGELPAAVIVALQQDMPGLFPGNEKLNTIGGELLLDLTELAHEDLGLPGLLPRRGRLLDLGARPVLASNSADLPAEGPVIGRLPGAGGLVLRVPERHRDQHTYLVGASGSGKSTTIFNSIIHDLARGHGVCLIDPHGPLFDRVLESIPADRIDDVIIIDPYDPDWVVGLNLLGSGEADPAFERQIATSEMLRLLDRLYDLHQTGGPMFETYIRNAMLLVMDSPSEGGTLIEVVRVFEEAEFRTRLVKACSDESVVSFWKRQAEPASGEASLDAMRPYITSKLNQFTQNSFVRPIIGQAHNTISFGATMNEGKIILVNLAVGQLGIRDVQLLGMIVMARLLRAAFSRGASSASSRRMHVYMDEFHYFLTDTMVAALSQSRKYNLCLHMAHQHFSQLTETRMGGQLLDAVLGNVGTKLLFRLGPLDAERASGWVRPQLRTDDLQRLENYDVVACLPRAEGPSSPVIVRTLPRVACPYDRADVSAIRRRQSNYARRRSDVEAEISERRRPQPSNGTLRLSRAVPSAAEQEIQRVLFPGSPCSGHEAS